MELVVNPAGMFRLDFDAILHGAKRQQSLHTANKDELAIASAAHTFFDLHVMRLIRDDDWVFDSALRFATDYSTECFRYLRTAAIEIYSVQQRLQQVNEKVIDIFARCGIMGAASAAGKIDLVKGSDFYHHIDISKLDHKTRLQARKVYEQAKEHEDTHVWVTLRGIRDLYEIDLPRVMYVVRRAIKVMEGSEPSASDENLTGISEYLDWYEAKVAESHALYPILRKLRPFYRLARNVASHHKGFTWTPDTDQIQLVDKDEKLEVHVHQFQQNFRHLVYICDLGIRGILSAFCGRDQGIISDELVISYANTFPEGFPDGIPGRVRFYVKREP